MHGPASLPLPGGHQLWYKEHGVSGDLGPDPVLPWNSRGSDLGQLPSLPRPPCIVRCWGVKGLCMGIALGDPQLLPPRTSQGRIASSRSPQWVLSHNHREGLGKGPLLLPSVGSHSLGPRTCPSHSPHLSFSAPSQEPTRTKTLRIPFPLPPLCPELFPRPRSCPRH